MSVAVREALPQPPEPPTSLLRKATEVAELVAGMRQAIDARLADDIARAQANEALTRAALAEAVIAAMAAAAEARASLRAMLRLSAPALRQVPNRLARRLHWRWRWVLARLGAPGQACLIAGSGLWRSGRGAGGLRRIAAYLARKADASAAPASFLDQAWYLARYPDVADLRLSPLLHYLLVGQGEGRDPHPLFGTSWYGRRYAEALAADLAWPLGHYLHAGAAARLDPHALFDSIHYLAQGATPAPGEDLVSHYLREGWRLGLSPHPLFDPAWYAEQLPAETLAATPPLLHYVLEGAAAGLSPHPLFDPAWYRAQAPHAGADPLRHYVEDGASLGLSPSRWFDPEHYAQRRGAALAAGANPLVDYLQGGAWAVGEPARGFATVAYVAAHPDLVRQDLTPLEHWARAATERRRPD